MILKMDYYIGSSPNKYYEWGDWGEWKFDDVITESSKLGFLVFRCKCKRVRSAKKFCTETNTSKPVRKTKYKIIAGSFSGNRFDAARVCVIFCKQLND